ncbi:rhodanese-like domain-containing protein [bacterium]|nr:rhodanese-like domain-containing protein [bacterium]
MRKRFKLLMLSLFMASVGFVGSPVLADAQKPRMLKPCAQCHEVEANQIRGRLEAKSRKAKTMKVFVGNGAWLVNFDENTKVDGAKSITKIPADHEVLVDFVQKGNILMATAVSSKQPATIPPAWILDVKEMEKLAAMGPEKGNYELFDARPGKLFLAGHIQGAVSNYDGQFDKNIGKLPQDKDKLLIFYCGGPT